MDFRFSEDFLKVLEFSRDEAVRTGWHNICPDHITLGILRHSDNGACLVLEALGVDPGLFKSSLDEALFVPEQVPWEERGSVNISASCSSLLQAASGHARECRSNFVEPLHFLLAASHLSGTYTYDFLNTRGIGPEAIMKAACISPAAPQKEAAAPDPMILATAIEKRIREGYSTDNPIVS